MSLNQMIDHTLLKADATREEIETLCREAMEYHFKTVCVNPYWVHYCNRLLAGSDVGITTVIGFPLGAMTTKMKIHETREAIYYGADEIDMVLNIGALKSYDFEGVRKDIAGVVAAAEPHPVKVILETCLLNEEEIRTACDLARLAGAAFVKTSTGFSTGGATVEDVRLMKECVGENMKVKASGGIRDAKTAKAMIEAGAERIGASASIAIVSGEDNE